MRAITLFLPLCLAVLGGGLPALGCKSRGSGALPMPSSSAQIRTSAPAPSDSLAVNPALLPEGPVLAIQAGKGVGPIRIGATVSTIERLMEAPCDVKTPRVCRYIRRAVEFHLDEHGVTERIVVHRRERPAGPDAQGKPELYGFFNGAIPPGAGLGMVPKAVLDILGPPQSSVRATEKSDFNTVTRDTYPGGMVLEYDEYKNGRVMLGGVIITKG